MTILCLGALLAGLVGGWLMPFPPFACVVLAAIALGAASATVEGAAVGVTALSAMALLFMSQTGYGLGLLILALFSQSRFERRVPADERPPPAARQLRTGNEPR